MATRKQYADYQQIEAIALPKKLGNLLKNSLLVNPSRWWNIWVDTATKLRFQTTV